MYRGQCRGGEGDKMQGQREGGIAFKGEVIYKMELHLGAGRGEGICNLCTLGNNEYYINI